jgi:23S rRNA-/tRNA-specific pseudouridylate synthase
LVEAVPVTGRTHQIRVHLAHLGSPIVGDVLYGNQDADAPTTLCLHALSLTIKHPGSGDEVTYSAGVPPWA